MERRMQVWRCFDRSRNCVRYMGRQMKIWRCFQWSKSCWHVDWLWHFLASSTVASERLERAGFQFLAIPAAKLPRVEWKEIQSWSSCKVNISRICNWDKSTCLHCTNMGKVIQNVRPNKWSNTKSYLSISLTYWRIEASYIKSAELWNYRGDHRFVFVEDHNIKLQNSKLKQVLEVF